MVNLIAFDTEKELCELTGLTESELWEKDLFSMIGILGFNQILNYSKKIFATDLLCREYFFIILPY